MGETFLLPATKNKFYPPKPKDPVADKLQKTFASRENVLTADRGSIHCKLWEMATQLRYKPGTSLDGTMQLEIQPTDEKLWSWQVTEKRCRPIEVHALKTQNAITTNASYTLPAILSQGSWADQKISKWLGSHCTTTICSPKLRPAPLVRLLLKVWCMVRFAKKKVWASFWTWTESHSCRRPP